MDLHKGVVMGLKQVCSGFAFSLQWVGKWFEMGFCGTTKSLQQGLQLVYMGLQGAYKRACNGLHGLCKGFEVGLQGACNEFIVGLQEV